VRLQRVEQDPREVRTSGGWKEHTGNQGEAAVTGVGEPMDTLESEAVVVESVVLDRDRDVDAMQQRNISHQIEVLVRPPLSTSSDLFVSLVFHHIHFFSPRHPIMSISLERYVAIGGYWIVLLLSTANDQTARWCSVVAATRLPGV
jgi:hypothetical protein